MKYTISESKLEGVLLKFLNLSFDGFEDMSIDWADFNCGMGICCDMFAIKFRSNDFEEYDDFLFKLVDGENYNSYGDYPEELMGELPEPCYNYPNFRDHRFDTIILSEETYERIGGMFGDINIWGDLFLNLINKIYGINSTEIDIE